MATTVRRVYSCDEPLEFWRLQAFVEEARLGSAPPTAVVDIDGDLDGWYLEVRW